MWNIYIIYIKELRIICVSSICGIVQWFKLVLYWYCYIDVNSVAMNIIIALVLMKWYININTHTHTHIYIYIYLKNINYWIVVI